MAGVPVRILKPTTFMNRSGAALASLRADPTFTPTSDLLILVDDFQIPLGTFRFRPDGSAGGHNGLKSIEGALQSQQYARLRIGVGPLPEGVNLELRPGPLQAELQALAGEGVQSLLLEGGPTLATAFLAAGLVDKLLMFVAPVVGGDGPRFLGELASPVELSRLTARAVGEDVLLEAYLD